MVFMKKKNAMFAITISMMMVLSLCIGTSAESKGHGLGYKPVDIDVNVVSNSKKSSPKLRLAPEELPAYYNPVDTQNPQSWFPTYVRNRNQASHATCWAFATANAADISYAKAENNSNVIPTSPGHFAYFFYNRVVDPLGLTKGDKNSASLSWCEEGGNNVWAFQAMANRMGLASEKIAPYNPSYGSCGYSYDKSLAYNLTYKCDKAILIETDSLSQYNTTEKRKTLIKNQILEHGAVATSIRWPICNGYTEDISKVYTRNDVRPTSDTNFGGHAITIIGWDDNYATTNFSKGWYNNNSQPTNKGAWICLNSWGSGYGDNNIFYVSYEDATMNIDNIATYEMSPAISNESVYQYDGSSQYNNPGYILNQGSQVANVFTSKCDEKITKVGFTEWNEGQTNYTIVIYKGLTSNNPISGIKVAEWNELTDHSGYYTFELETPVEINKGDKFSVVIQLNTNTTSFGFEAATSDVVVSPNQSFYKMDSSSTWEDFYNENGCFRIKAITERTGKFDQVISGTATQEYQVGVQGKSIGAKTDGNGILSYSVKSGDTVVGVNESTGALTLKKAGTAVVTVNARETDDYAAASKDFTIKVIGKPAKVSGLKVKVGKKQLTVSYKKATNAAKYQISVATSKKKTTVKRTTTKLKETIKKLKSKKYYYVKVRGANKFGTYGAWSIVKKVKVK